MTQQMEPTNHKQQDLGELKLLERPPDVELDSTSQTKSCIQDLSFFETLSNAMCILHASNSNDRDHTDTLEMYKNIPPGFEAYVKNKLFQNRWSCHRIFDMIDPVLRQRLSTSINPESEPIFNAKGGVMNMSDPLTVKVIVDLCKKLNLHIVIYGIKSVDPVNKKRSSYESEEDMTIYDDMIYLGNQILCVKPRSTFNKTINVVGSPMLPRKISIAYRVTSWRANFGRADHSSRQHNETGKTQDMFSLILSKTPHSEELKVGNQISNPYLSPLADVATRYYVHDYRAESDVYESLQRIAKSVVDFVFVEPDTIPIKITKTTQNSQLVKQNETPTDLGKELYSELCTEPRTDLYVPPEPVPIMPIARVRVIRDKYGILSNYQIVLNALKDKHSKLVSSIDLTEKQIDALVKRESYLKLLLSSFQCMMSAEDVCVKNLQLILGNVTKSQSVERQIDVQVQNGEAKSSSTAEHKQELVTETKDTLSIVGKVMGSLHTKEEDIKKMMIENDSEIKKKRIVKDMKIQSLYGLTKYITDLETSYSLHKFQEKRTDRSDGSIVKQTSSTEITTTDDDGFITPHKRNRSKHEKQDIKPVLPRGPIRILSRNHPNDGKI